MQLVAYVAQDVYFTFFICTIDELIDLQIDELIDPQFPLELIDPRRAPARERHRRDEDETARENETGPEKER